MGPRVNLCDSICEHVLILVIMIDWCTQCSVVAESDPSSQPLTVASVKRHSTVRTLSSAATESHPGTSHWHIVPVDQCDLR